MSPIAPVTIKAITYLLNPHKAIVLAARMTKYQSQLFVYMHVTKYCYKHSEKIVPKT